MSGINATMSALLGFQKKVETTAHNVANVNTDAFKRTKATLNEGENGGVTVTLQQMNEPGPTVYEQTANGEELVEQSNVELTEEMPNLLLARRSFQANIKVIQTEDEMLGSLLDIKS